MSDIIQKLKREDLTIDEYESLYPTYNLLDGVNFSTLDYYKTNTGEIWEVGYCTDGSLSKRMRLLEQYQNKKELMKSFGFQEYKNIRWINKNEDYI